MAFHAQCRPDRRRRSWKQSRQRNPILTEVLRGPARPGKKRVAAASSLVDLHRLLHDFPETSLLPDFGLVFPRGTLWPKSHNALFDFSRRPEGAGWIGRKASEAKELSAGAERDDRRRAYSTGRKSFTVKPVIAGTRRIP